MRKVAISFEKMPVPERKNCMLLAYTAGRPFRQNGALSRFKAFRATGGEFALSRCMNRKTLIVPAALIAGILTSFDVASPKDKKEPTKEEKLLRDADKLSREIRETRAYAGRQPAVLQEVAPLLAVAENLAQEVRDKLAGGETYVADRLMDAGEDIQDACRYLANARLRLRWDDGKARPPRDGENDKRDAAQELERAYFRTAQLNFLGRQAGAERMSSLAGQSRRLYQEGRAAFDRQDYFLAEQLALASRNLTSAVEGYIQSLLPADLPPPPKVPKK